MVSQSTTPDFTTSNPQTQSRLATLPVEIRLKIYSHVWAAEGSTQHIIFSGLYHWSKPRCPSQFYHVACVTDHSAPDTSREGSLQNLYYEESVERRANDPTFLDGTDPRWKEDCYYCKDFFDCCFDQSNQPFPPIEKSAFMGMLLLCKAL